MPLRLKKSFLEGNGHQQTNLYDDHVFLRLEISDSLDRFLP